MIYYFLSVYLRIYSLEELQDFPINISNIQNPQKTIEYDINGSYIGLPEPSFLGNRENVLQLLKSDNGHVIEASNRFVTTTFKNELVLTKNITHATTFRISPRGAGFIFQLGNKCLFTRSSRLGLEICEEVTMPWKHSPQVFMICLLPNSMLKLFYEMCDDDLDCESNGNDKDVNLEEMFENSIIDNVLAEPLKPFINANIRKKEKENFCKNNRVDRKVNEPDTN